MSDIEIREQEDRFVIRFRTLEGDADRESVRSFESLRSVMKRTLILRIPIGEPSVIPLIM